MNKTPILMTLAILGGTGKEGKGLAYRWAKAGYRILIGSRILDKAQAVAEELSTLLSGEAAIEGVLNLTAALQADIVALTVPYSAHRETLELVKDALKGKILIDVTVPVDPLKQTRAKMPPDGSAALEAYKILGNNVQVTSAFQNISHENLMQDGPVDCDVLVTGTNKEARSETLKLVSSAGLTGWDAGPLENSAVVEGLTSILININKQYQSTTAGIRVTGVRFPV